VVQIENQLPVGGFALALLFQLVCAASGIELSGLPRLAFILAKVLDCKRLYTGGGQKTLASSVNCKPATRWREPQPDMSFYEKYFDAIETLMAAFQEALPAELRNSLVEKMQVFESRYEDRL
jgi:hypothetical protein